MLNVDKSLIKKYPFLGYSTNLMEYFAVIGYEETILKQFIIPQYPKTDIINPTILSSITSKQDFGITIDNDLIIRQVYPYNPSIIPINNIAPPPSSLISSFCFDTYNGKTKQFYVCYAYLFYETFKEYQYHIPKAFCIVSQYPFFTTFNKICLNLHKIAINYKLLNYNIDAPIEFIIYNIVNFIPSPINFNINLDIFDHENNLELPNTFLELKQLSGYPYVDFDLSQLFNYLPLNFVIQIFLFTVLEVHMLFFSPNTEILNMIMYIMSILSYPCTDSTYFWHIVSVSRKVLEENNGENKFVTKIFSSLLGVTSGYTDSINTFGFNASHFIVDLENKRMFLRVSSTMEESEKKELKKLVNLQDYIELILKDKKMESFFLKKFVSTLYHDLETILKEGNPNYNPNPKTNNTTYKTINFFEWNKDIYIKNRKIQEIFYNFYLNILMIFYQDNTLSSSFDKINKDEEKENEKKLYFLCYQESEKSVKFSKEEKTFCEMFRQSVKYNVFLNNFIQNFDCMELYKIPFVFSEEFIIMKKKDKTENLRKYISFFDIIDKYYFNTTSDGNQIINITMNNFYSIYQESIHNIVTNLKTTKRGLLFNLNKTLIKVYINYLINLPPEELNSIFPSINIQRADEIVKIQKSTILQVLETELIEKGLITNKALIFYSLILTYSLGFSYCSFRTAMNCINSINLRMEKINFLLRKYTYNLLLSFYKHLINVKGLPKNLKVTRQQLKMFYFIQVNFIRNNYILPNEEMLNLLKLFIKGEASAPSKQENQISEDDLKIEDNNYQIYMSYCFSREGTKKPNEMVNLAIKNMNDEDIKLKGTDKELNPKINLRIGKKVLMSSFYSPKKVFRISTALFNQFLESNEINIKTAINIEELQNIIINLIFYEKYIQKEEIDYSFLIDILNNVND